MKRVVRFLASMVMTSAMVFAQDKVVQKIKPEAFPSATFAVSFEKLSSGNPLFSWRADMGVDFVGYRKGPHNLTGKVTFLTIGAQQSYGRINIAGTAYGLEGCYRYHRTETNWFSVCDSHLSSHRAEELAGLVTELIRGGEQYPVIRAGDLNVISFTSGFMLKMPTHPRFVLRFQPASFNYGGGAEFYSQPFYFTSRFTLVKSQYAKLSLATKHELGISSFNDGYLNFDLFPHGQEEGRAQIFVGYSPNTQIQPSINEGVRRGGFKTGIRLIWDAH